MDVQKINKREAALDSFVQATIDRLALSGLGLILLCALFALLVKGAISILWSNTLPESDIKASPLPRSNSNITYDSINYRAPGQP